MSLSSTIIAALRFNNGVVIGADSQTSDLVNGVRWESGKLNRIGETSLVVGFTGQTGPIENMRVALAHEAESLAEFERHAHLVRHIHQTLSPIFRELYQQYPDAKWDTIWKVLVGGLAAYWAEGNPRILEIEANGQCETHRSFRAIGSGARSSYAAWRALGGEQLSQLQEGIALQVMLRILEVCIETEVSGVSDPVIMWVVEEGRVRRVADSQMDNLREVAQRDFLFSLNNHPIRN